MARNINDLDKVFEFKDAYTVVAEYLAQVEDDIKNRQAGTHEADIWRDAQKRVLEDILATFLNDRAMLDMIEKAQDREDRA